MYEEMYGGQVRVVKTKIDNLQLSRWQERLPDCAKFLWDYFSNVEERYNWVPIFRGYMLDFELEVLENPGFSRFESDLLEAFFDITRDVDETDECAYKPLRIGFSEVEKYDDDDYSGDGGLKMGRMVFCCLSGNK